ncbi:hypothetical protein JWH17_20480 [Desulfobulbus marinus]|nr:hypothetical protein [Desulfogranum marinum]MBM9514778.1 hypothetical protein [Desulfogranum marinum]
MSLDVLSILHHFVDVIRERGSKPFTVSIFKDLRLIFGYNPGDVDIKNLP